MKKSIKYAFLLLLIIGGAVVCTLVPQAHERRLKLEAMNADPVIIGHALGQIEERTYTNSLEALDFTYQSGCRVFEADIQTTSDNHLVLRHDWTKKRGQKGLLKENGYIPTLEEFKSIPFYKKFTPLSLADLFEYMKTHRDMYVITDTKAADLTEVTQQFELLVKTANETGSKACLDRLIIQIYNDEMLETVKSVYPFKDFIYTVYQRGTDNFEDLCKFCVDNGISIITMNQNKFKDEYMELIKQYGLKLFLHTVNDPEKANQFHDKGVSGFYTDLLTAEVFE